LEDPPRISIVTPSYNQAGFLDRAIQSVLNQRYPELEYIVQDGGSTDGTDEVLARYDGELHRWEMRPDRGQANAINLGFAHASGEIMAYLNADDLILPGALAYVARYFERHPDVDVVYGHRVLIDDNDMEIGRWVMPQHDDDVLSWVDYVPQETLYWRRRVWAGSGGGMDEDAQYALDWDLLLRFRDAGARIVRVPRFLGAFRVHPDQKTLADAETTGKSEVDRIRLREHGRLVSRQEMRRALRRYLWRHVVLHKLYRAHLLRY
jgi:glycosyltransferase involved in cell wall biosynthesis